MPGTAQTLTDLEYVPGCNRQVKLNRNRSFASHHVVGEISCSPESIEIMRMPSPVIFDQPQFHHSRVLDQRRISHFALLDCTHR